MRRAQRIKCQLPPCYHEGFLEKRSFKDKTGRKLWTALCGNSLFFYNNSKDNNYVEKQDLSDFISLTDDASLDRKLDAARLHLRLKDDYIFLTAPTLEARELWKGFILSVVKLEVPTSLNLLPGQIHMLREAVEKENERLKDIAEKRASSLASITVATKDCGDYLSVLSEMPVCFHMVSRGEAEVLLEKHNGKGNLLLRPSQNGTCFAVTTLQDFNGPVFRHYRVTRIPDGGFAIAVDNPITCNTLHDVIEYLMETTGGVLKPLVLENTYEESIEYFEHNKENGEKNVRCASGSPVGAKTPPKAENVEDNKENGEKSVCWASGTPVGPKPPPKPAPKKKLSGEDESIYQNLSDEDFPPNVLPRAPVKSSEYQATLPDLHMGPGGALLPPSEHKRSVAAVPDTKPKRTVPPVPIAGNLSQSFSEELKQRLQLRATSD